MSNLYPWHPPHAKCQFCLITKRDQHYFPLSKFCLTTIRESVSFAEEHSSLLTFLFLYDVSVEIALLSSTWHPETHAELWFAENGKTWFVPPLSSGPRKHGSGGGVEHPLLLSGTSMFDNRKPHFIITWLAWSNLHPYGTTSHRYEKSSTPCTAHSLITDINNHYENNCLERKKNSKVASTKELKQCRPARRSNSGGPTCKNHGALQLTRSQLLF